MFAYRGIDYMTVQIVEGSGYILVPVLSYVFLKETGTTASVHRTMVSAHGLKPNANADDIQSVVTLDDLFAV